MDPDYVASMIVAIALNYVFEDISVWNKHNWHLFKYQRKRLLNETKLDDALTLTVGSGSSRNPSARVTIIAIDAEISPATCSRKKVNDSFYWPTKSLQYSKSNAVNGEKFVLWPAFCLPSSPAPPSWRAPCWPQMTWRLRRICCWPQMQSAPEREWWIKQLNIFHTPCGKDLHFDGTDFVRPDWLVFSMLT